MTSLVSRALSHISIEGSKSERIHGLLRVSLYKLNRCDRLQEGTRGCRSPDYTLRPQCPLVGLAAVSPEAVSVCGLQTTTANSVSSIVSKAKVIPAVPGFLQLCFIYSDLSWLLYFAFLRQLSPLLVYSYCHQI